MALLRGVDVSAYQTVSSWSRVREGGYRYAIVKATEGSSHISDTFFDYYAGARSADVVAGSYHFARPSGNDAGGEARYYVDQLRRAGFESGRDLPPVLDIEDTGGLGYNALTRWCLDFVQRVDSELNLKDPWLRCGVYMNNDYRRNRLDGNRLLDGRWLWLALWPSGQRQPDDESEMPSGAAIWQWTDSGNVPGIAENTDLNVVSQADFRRLTGGSGEEEEMPTFRHYGIDKPVEIPPKGSDGAIPKPLSFDVNRADPDPKSHKEGSASYIRKGKAGWAQHELSGLQVEGMKEGDEYAVQIIELDPSGDEVTWSNVLTEGRATTGKEFVSVSRTMSTAKDAHVRWRFLYRGTQQDVKITRASWIVTEW